MFHPSYSLLIGRALGLSALALVAACGGDKSPEGGNGGSPGSGGSGGASAARGGSVAGGAGGAGACVDPTKSCAAAPVGAASDTLLYDGALVADMCAPGLAMPRTGNWFGYGDSTVGATRTQVAERNGRSGTNDCAFHAKGSGYADYGAGVGFDVNFVAMTTCPYDASAYTGVRAYLKGSTTGTRAANYAATANSVRVKLVTSDDRVCPETDRSGGDDFGAWCTINETDWTLCTVPFATSTREGFKASYTASALDPKKLTKIQFEFAKEQMSMPVAFDVWIDDVEFY